MKKNHCAVKWIYSKTKSKFHLIIILTLLAVAISFLSVRFALLSKQLVDSAVSAPEKIIQNGVFLAILIGIQLVIQFLYSMICVKTEGKLKISLRSYIFRLILKKNYLEVTKFHTGELINRITSDTDVIVSAIINIIPNAFSLTAQIILSLVVLFALDKFLGFACLFLAPVLLIFAKIYSNFIKPLHKEFQKTNGITRSFFMECLQNILVLKTFVNENAVCAHSDKLQWKNYFAAFRKNMFIVTGSILFYLVLTVGFYFSMFWCTCKISDGVMTFGTLTAILQLVGNIQTPFKSISGIMPQYYSAVASAERLMEFENLKNDVITNYVEPKNIYEQLNSIEFCDVSFKYDNDYVLNNANLTINKGEFLAIAGDSGIGKSTMQKLLLAVITPESGKILLNMKSQISELDSTYRSLFSYVPQTNMIFSGTIYENIVFYRDNIDTLRVENAAKLSCIWDYICQLPNGLNTVIGERGTGLSEGQIQRIAIARSLVSDAPIILLDEATSSLDEKTETQILKNIRDIANKTFIVITHRPAAFSICDRKIKMIDKHFI